MPTLSEQAPPTEVDASTLCLACGLCCNGVLHSEARLSPQEIPFAESLGLTTYVKENKAYFNLPCPRWQGGHCTVHPVRPNVCGDYRCKLLRALDSREVTLDTALAHVAKVKTTINEINAFIDHPPATGSIWQRANNFAERNGLRLNSVQFALAFPALKLKISALHWLLKRHFLKQTSTSPATTNG